LPTSAGISKNTRPGGSRGGARPSATGVARERLRSLAWLLDSSISLPGTRFTIGVDALIGLVPVLGDVIGVFLSSYILSEAAKLGAPKPVLMRMSLNIAVEGIVGMLPIVGDAFDAVWKANQRNVRLLDQYFENPSRTRASSGALVALLVVLLVALFLGAAVVTAAILRWAWQMVSG
jgi:hypothetical protein